MYMCPHFRWCFPGGAIESLLDVPLTFHTAKPYSFHPKISSFNIQILSQKDVPLVCSEGHLIKAISKIKKNYTEKGMESIKYSPRLQKNVVLAFKIYLTKIVCVPCIKVHLIKAIDEDRCRKPNKPQGFQSQLL